MKPFAETEILRRQYGEGCFKAMGLNVCFLDKIVMLTRLVRLVFWAGLYSQLSFLRTPSGPRFSVRNRESPLYRELFSVILMARDFSSCP